MEVDFTFLFEHCEFTVNEERQVLNLRALHLLLEPSEIRHWTWPSDLGTCYMLKV